MTRTPFDLSFDELIVAGAKASEAAALASKKAGVEVAMLDATVPLLATGWTDERVELLQKLWRDGHTASQIAKLLSGVTANAVLHKMQRLGLSGGVGMSWTAERVELLKKLWQDGLSASQIAKQLGGVTSNAVINKVHRLGLSGRATPSKLQRTVFKAPRAPRPVSEPSTSRRIAEPVSAQAQPSPVRYVDEEPGMATVLTLGAHMCKWPIGDPSLDSFTFCGRRTEEGGLYCRQHADVAYQPAAAKKRSVAAKIAEELRKGA